MRRLDDITPDMAGAKYFTVADTKNGYWHVRLDVVIPVVLMLHNHKMDLLMMDNMLFVIDVYRRQPPDISRDIGYEHYDEQDYYCYIHVYINLEH